MEFEITYFYGKTKKYRTTNNQQEPLSYEEAVNLYYKMKAYALRFPQLYSGVDCNFKHLLKADF